MSAKAMKLGSGDVDPGSASTWLRKLFQTAEIDRSGGIAVTRVPCGDCTACCRSRATEINLRQDEIQSFPEAIDWPNHPGEKILPKNPDGSCMHLSERGCEIYERRPRCCRAYDCRVHIFFGMIACDEDDALLEGVRRWQAPKFKTPEDRVILTAMKIAAASTKREATNYLEHFEKSLRAMPKAIEAAKGFLARVMALPFDERQELARAYKDEDA